MEKKQRLPLGGANEANASELKQAVLLQTKEGVTRAIESRGRGRVARGQLNSCQFLAYAVRLRHQQRGHGGRRSRKSVRKNNCMNMKEFEKIEKRQKKQSTRRICISSQNEGVSCGTESMALSKVETNRKRYLPLCWKLKTNPGRRIVHNNMGLRHGRFAEYLTRVTPIVGTKIGKR